ncbi:hypothetical protein FQN49_004401 [Arthroderma sp. PD_2]|nr:hypothetical protein FQN49_004401 [Arthroderma sp. PD_2]
MEHRVVADPESPCTAHEERSLSYGEPDFEMIELIAANASAVGGRPRVGRARRMDPFIATFLVIGVLILTIVVGLAVQIVNLYVLRKMPWKPVIAEQ